MRPPLPLPREGHLLARAASEVAPADTAELEPSAALPSPGVQEPVTEKR